MKVTILSENLKKTLSIVSRGVSTRPHLPILSGVMIKATSEGLFLTSTDLELSFWVKMGARVEEEGSVVIPAKLLYELVVSLPAGPLVLETVEDTMKLVTNSVKAEIVGQPPEDFPVIPRAGKTQATLSAGDFREVVERVCVSAARDDTRPVLTGVLWQFDESQVVLAATDGYRLSVDRMNLKKNYEGKDKKVILPARALLEVSKVLSETGSDVLGMDFDKENQQVVFSIGEIEVSSRLVAGEFPPYQQIMPNTYKTNLEFSKNDFADAVKRAKLFAKDNANIVKLSVEKGKIVVRAESSQIGNNETEIDAEVEGENITVAFNAQYLLDYLAILSEEKMIWETEGELKPSVFKSSDPDWIQVVMPVRVQS